MGIEIGGFLFVGGHTLRLVRRLFFLVRVDSLWSISHMLIIDDEEQFTFSLAKLLG